jgi:Fe-S-cluster containining protein
VASAGCAGCGRCCDPVILDHGTYTEAVAEARGEGEKRPSVVFIAQHWHPVSAWRDSDGEVMLDLRCDAFDPVTRLCTARGQRPLVCRDYPWYGDDPVTSGRAATLYPECSYLADVPPAARPEGARPLIPITVAR